MPTLGSFEMILLQSQLKSGRLKIFLDCVTLSTNAILPVAIMKRSCVFIALCLLATQIYCQTVW